MTKIISISVVGCHLIHLEVLLCYVNIVCEFRLLVECVTRQFIAKNQPFKLLLHLVSQFEQNFALFTLSLSNIVQFNNIYALASSQTYAQ